MANHWLLNSDGAARKVLVTKGSTLRMTSGRPPLYSQLT